MKKVKKLSLTIACGMLLQSQVFGNITSYPNPGNIYTQSIGLLDSNLRGYLGQMGNNYTKNIYDLLNTIFADPTGGYLSKLLTTLVNTTIRDLVPLYAKRTDFSSVDFTSANAFNKAGLSTLFAKAVGYNITRTARERVDDIKQLLLQKFEGGNNDFDPALFNPSPTATPYKSLEDDPKKPIVPDTDAPTVLDLLGTDAYKDDTAKSKAKLFISFILQAVPPPKNFVIPDPRSSPFQQPAGGIVSMYLPYPDKDAGTPYTIKQISLMPNSKYSDAPRDEYTRMKNFLQNDTKFYQPYKAKVRAANVLRTLFTDVLFRAYQERLQDTSSQGSLSLVEREKMLAYSGLDKNYYETLINGDPSKKLAPATIIDLTIEGLKSVNKLAYFMYRIHQDIERLTLITAIGNLLSTNISSTQDNTNYIKPISLLIKKGCWDKNIPNSPLSDSDKSACEDPMSVTSSASDIGGTDY